MRTLTQYEVAWNMYQAKASMEQITATVGKHRATIYRWLARIKRLGVREFIRRKQTSKRRRQPRKLSVAICHLIRDLRRRYHWCGQKIQQELRVKHQLYLSLMTIYRVLRQYFKIGKKFPYKARGRAPLVTAPRQIVEHDTVDFGSLFAYTAIDIFTKEPAVVMATDLTMATGARVFRRQKAAFGPVALHQSDEGTEFGSRFVKAVLNSGAKHRYARPYKKNDQAHIENFNRSLRKECLGWSKYRKEDIEWVQTRVDQWLKHWMEERWHMGLPGMMTPTQHLKWYNDGQREQKVAFAL